MIFKRGGGGIGVSKQTRSGEIKKNKKLIPPKKMEWRNIFFLTNKNFNHSKIKAANPSAIKLIWCGLSIIQSRGPSKHGTIAQCWFIVGPALQMLVQH